MIDSTHPLYNVNDVLNGIYVHGNVLGDVMFFGAGAGKLPTASAVVSDVVDCVKHKGKNVMTIWSSVKQELGDTFDETRRQHLGKDMLLRLMELTESSDLLQNL